VELERNPSDPSNLDVDDDGGACEDFDYGTSRTILHGGDAGGQSTAEDAKRAGKQSADAGFARCDFFLHVVRYDRGNVRYQYRADELIVRRFEQCLF
jgi:hypothetical protein